MTTCSFSRSNRLVVFLKVAVLKNFEMITVKYLYCSLFLKNTTGRRPKILLKQYYGIGASCEFWDMFQNSCSLENVRTAVSESPQCIVQFIKSTAKKPWTFKLIPCNVFSTWNLFKNMKKISSWYEKFLIYLMKLSGLWFRIRTLSGYFLVKWRCSKN